MKKLLALLLSVAFVFSFAACETAVETESSVDTGETSDESIVLEEFVLNENIEKINAYLSEEADRTMKADNLFKGLHYEFSRVTNTTYTDNGGWKLTDGSTVDVFDTYTFVGWDGRSEVFIDFDLGTPVYSIADIEVGCLRVMDYGIGLPEYVAIQVSNDGESFTEVARIFTPKDISDSAKYVYNFAFEKAVKARYFRIYCAPQDNAFLFIDEISAYQYSENGTIDRTLGADADQVYTVTDFYDYELNRGESDVSANESDADYNTEQNLARLSGVDFQVFHFDPLRADHTNSPKEKLALLTDGELHGDLYAAYFNSQRGGGRHIVADLGHVMSVSGTTFSFYDRYTWGVSTPPAYYVSLSENGVDWVTVYGYYNENYGKTEKVNDTHSIEFASDYRARYVRLTFQTVPDNTISSSVYLGEFEVIGKKNPNGAVTAKEDDSPYGKFVSTEKYGIDNILFAPITDGYGKHCTDVHVMTEESAYIYLAAFDENGKANGVFMDSMAFSTRGALNDHKDRSEGMLWFFDELFYDGLNLDAVEAAKGKLNAELGTDDKVKIWINVNAPAEGDTFNGKPVTTEEEYNACLEWQVDEIIRRFNEQNYRNLEFVGIYWQFEAVRSEDDVEGMKKLNEYVHSKGYMTLWCPYFNAAGIYYNHYVGFDIACLQPNYMFYDTEPTRLQTAAELAKLYGMCVEIEIEGGTQSEDSLRMYRDYLKAGYDTGYMESVKVYYQGGLPGAFVQGYKSDDQYQRAIYDETVLYALCKLDKDYHTDDLIDLNDFQDGEITVKHGKSATIEIGDLGDKTYRYVTTPTYGAVRLDTDGTLSYTAMKGYKGEDIIKIEIFDGISETRIITIKCTITE